MKKFAVLVLVFLAGCTATPEKLNKVAAIEANRAAKPSKPLSAFSSYELRPITLSDKIKSEPEKVEQAAVLDQKINEKLLPLFADWSSSDDTGRSGTLIVQPELVSLRIVSGGARFFAGAFAGGSKIDMDLVLIDSSTNDVIAKPRITKDAGAMTGAWSIGQSDKNLHDYISHIAYQYLLMNY